MLLPPCSRGVISLTKSASDTLGEAPLLPRLRPKTCPDHSCPLSNKPFIEKETPSLPRPRAVGFLEVRSQPSCPWEDSPQAVTAQEALLGQGLTCAHWCPLYHWAHLREQPDPGGGRAWFGFQMCLFVFLSLLPTFKN